MIDKDAETRRLTIEVRELSEELEEWRSGAAELRSRDVGREEAARRRFGLRPFEAAMLVMMLDRAPALCRNTALFNLRDRSLDEDVLMKPAIGVRICYLRKALNREMGAACVRTVWSQGYYIERDVARAIEERLLPAMAA